MKSFAVSRRPRNAIIRLSFLEIAERLSLARSAYHGSRGNQNHPVNKRESDVVRTVHTFTDKTRGDRRLSGPPVLLFLRPVIDIITGLNYLFGVLIMKVHRISIYRAVMSSDTASGLIRIVDLAAAVSEVCTPNKDVAFPSGKLCSGNVSSCSALIEVLVITTKLIASGRPPLVLAFK